MDTQRMKGVVLLVVNVLVVGLILFAVMKGPVGTPMMGSPPSGAADAEGSDPAAANAAAASSHGGGSGKHGSKEKKVSSAAPAATGAVAASGARVAARGGDDGSDTAARTALDAPGAGALFSPSIVVETSGGARGADAAEDDSTLVGKNNAGVRLFNAGNYEAAMLEFEAAYAASPEDPVVRRNLACTLAQSAVLRAQDAGAGGTTDAVALVERAAALQPDNADLLRLSGELHFRAGDNTRARHALEGAETLAPQDADVQRVLGEIAYREERLDEAVRRWKRAVELGEDDPRLASRLAKAERERGVEREMDVVRDRHFAVKFAEGETGAAGEAELALRALDRIRERVGRELEWFPARPIAVILYSGEEFRVVTGAHAWMGGLFDGKIRIPIRGVDRIDENVEKLLAHEYAHAMIAERTGGGAPGWLDEGFAQWVAGEWSGRRAEDAAMRVRGGALIDFASLEGSFTRITDPALAEQAYFQAFLAVDYLMDRFGADDLQLFLERVGNDTPPEKALEEIYRMTYPRLADAVGSHLAELYPTF